MDVNLTLIVATHGSFLPEERIVLGHTILATDRDYPLWGKILDLPSQAVPGDTLSSWFSPREDGECQYGFMNRNAYGYPLRWVQAADLARCLRKHYRTRPPGPWTLNLAAIGYMANLPGDNPVVLYWN